MTSNVDFLMYYNSMPLFDLTPYDDVKKSLLPEDEDEFALAYDTLEGYNYFAAMLKDQAKFRAETGEVPSSENYHKAFQGAICAIREKKLEDIESEIDSVEKHEGEICIDVGKINVFAKKHFDALNKAVANKARSLLNKSVKITKS